jgi:hypothetical protein
LKSWHLVCEPSLSPRGSSAGTHTPRREWFAHSFVPSHASAYIGSVSDHRAANGTTKYPESLCLILALPLSGRRVPSPAGTLLPGLGSYRLMCQSRSALLSFGLSLVRGVSAGCYQPLLPAGWDRTRARPSLGGGLPFLLFRLQDGFTIPPWRRFPRPPYDPGRPDFPGPVRNLGLSSMGLPIAPRGLSAGSHAPLLAIVCS